MRDIDDLAVITHVPNAVRFLGSLSARLLPMFSRTLISENCAFLPLISFDLKAQCSLHQKRLPFCLTGHPAQGPPKLGAKASGNSCRKDHSLGCAETAQPCGKAKIQIIALTRPGGANCWEKRLQQQLCETRREPLLKEAGRFGVSSVIVVALEKSEKWKSACEHKRSG